jgi:hypothetical protein
VTALPQRDMKFPQCSHWPHNFLHFMLDLWNKGGISCLWGCLCYRPHAALYENFCCPS